MKQKISFEELIINLFNISLISRRGYDAC